MNNSRKFISSLLAIAQRATVVEIVDACMEASKEREAMFNLRNMATVDCIWREWIQMRQTGKWHGYAMRTISSLASQTNNRQNALLVYARVAFKVALRAAWYRAEKKAEEIRTSAHNDASSKEIEAVKLAFVAKAKARLNQLAEDC